MKQSLKNILSVIIFYSGLFSVFRLIQKKAAHEKRIVILKYHSIADAKEINGCRGITKKDFERQVKYLSKKYSVITLEYLVDYLNRKKELPKNPVIITFDDGHEDFYKNAYPILKKYNVPAVVFVITGYIDAQKPMWWDKLADMIMHTPQKTLDIPHSIRKKFKIEPRLQNMSIATYPEKLDVYNRLNYWLKMLEPSERDIFVKEISKSLIGNGKNVSNVGRFPMSWEQIREISENSISIGAHTITHPTLTKISLKEVEREIVESKTKIEKEIGKPVTSFAYPSGYFDDGTKEILKNNDYLCACSSVEGVNTPESDLYSLKRMGIEWAQGLLGRYSKSLFALEVSGLSDILFGRFWRHRYTEGVSEWVSK